MKKNLLSIIMLFICLSLCACGGNAPREIVKINEDGSKCTTAEDKNGNIVYEYVEFTDGSTVRFNYNDDGTYTELSTYPDGSCIKWEYCADGTRIEIGTDSEGSVRIFTYDKDGICISEIGDLIDGTHYETYFDQYGNIISEIYETSDDSVYEATENGSEIYIAPDGSVYEHIYDEQGNHTEIYTAPDGSVVEHVYDPSGKQISENFYDKDGNIIN